MSRLPRTARMHGLWALIGSGPLDPGFHAKLLTHPDPGFRAWGVRAAGNMGRVEPAILETGPRPGPGTRATDVKLQVAIAARKLQGVDPLQVLDRGPGRPAARDALLPQIVWQNLHPLLEGRQVELALWARRVGPGRTRPPRSAPGRVAAGQSQGRSRISSWACCSRATNVNALREAFDLLAERFRERSLPAPLEDGDASGADTLLEACVGSRASRFMMTIRSCWHTAETKTSLKEVWTIARTTWKDKDVEDRNHWEAMRIQGRERDPLPKDPGVDSFPGREHPRRGRRDRARSTSGAMSSMRSTASTIRRWPRSCSKPMASYLPR